MPTASRSAPGSTANPTRWNLLPSAQWFVPPTYRCGSRFDCRADSPPKAASSPVWSDSSATICLLGVEGFSFGFLTRDLEIDTELCTTLAAGAG